MSRYARNVDANQSAIVAALRKVGALVHPISTLGGGVPDLLVGYRGENFLLEVKNPATRYGQGKRDNEAGTNARQAKWRAAWCGKVAVVTTTVEALQAIGANSTAPSGGGPDCDDVSCGHWRCGR